MYSNEKLSLFFQDSISGEIARENFFLKANAILMFEVFALLFLNVKGIDTGGSFLTSTIFLLFILVVSEVLFQRHASNLRNLCGKPKN